MDAALETFSTQRFGLPRAEKTDLFLRTLFIVALASGNRMSELATTRQEGVGIRGDKLALPVDTSFLFKTQSFTRPSPPPISFPLLGNLNTLCPWRNLQFYLASTSPPAGSNAIFLHPTTNVPLQAGRLAYWLSKAIVVGAGKTSGASGRDIRKIALSLAFTRGLPVEDIIDSAFWHSTHVFVENICVMLQNLMFQ